MRHVCGSRVLHLSCEFPKAHIFQYKVVITFVWQRAYVDTDIEDFFRTLFYYQIDLGVHVSGCLGLCLLLKRVNECMGFFILEYQPAEPNFKDQCLYQWISGCFASTCNSIAKNPKQMRQWHGMRGKVAKFINFVLCIKRKIIIDAKNRQGNCLYDSNITELISIWSLAVQISGCISACWWTPAEHHFKLRVLFQFWSLEYAKGWVSWQLGTESLNITQQSYE